jgi:hypothetical protein
MRYFQFGTFKSSRHAVVWTAPSNA